ncbi:hypothetical protein ACGFIU_05335 [Rhodococcus oryzae]|uniref:hypothetical protein n=1 Tax=Rhodococcus oryzae TaxID=2571143 RepID=UPI00371A1E2C
MITTHLFTFNGSGISARGPHARLESFTRPLRRFNGNDRFSLNLAKMPSPTWLDDLTEDDMRRMGEEYLQCAGSAEAMSVEIRTKVGGVPRLYTIGRPGLRQGEPTVEIPFQEGNRVLHVYPSEVFIADEAAGMFFEYHCSNSIPEGLQLREIDLDAFVPPRKSESE